VNGPAATETADVTVIDGSFKEARLSQFCCPHAVVATESAEITRTIRIEIIRMSISLPGPSLLIKDVAHAR
jgi:hypothetical protein